jgi:hypothetical protein
MKPTAIFILFLVVFCFLEATPASGTWPENGILVYSEGAYEDCPTVMIADGAGGAILAMYSEEYHGFASYGVVQKIDSAGALQWDPPVFLSAIGDYTWPADMVSDKVGGAFVAYCGYMLVTKSYAKRIYTHGGTMGLPVCGEEEGIIAEPCIIGGDMWDAIIAFAYTPEGAIKDIYAQRDSSNGSALWGTCGIAVCTAAEWQTEPRIATDAEGGAVIAWKDYRDGNADLYAQRVNPAGTMLWAADGIPVCTESGSQERHQIMADGTGGVFIVWQDKRSGNFDIYAQRINSYGMVLWTTDGVAVCTEKNDQDYPFLVSDDAGGGLIVWRDSRDGNYDVYAQRFDDNGNMLWPHDGVAIAGGAGNQRCQRIAADGAGGAIIAWVDETGVDFDVYAQRIDGNGDFVWPGDRVPVCTAAGNQDNLAMAGVGTGAAIVAWKDERSGEPYVSDVYAMMLNDDTITGIIESGHVHPYGVEIQIINYPNPFNPGTSIEYRIAKRCHVILRIYDITGREIKCLIDREESGGVRSIEWNGTDEGGAPVASGVYFARLDAGAGSTTVKMVLLR